MKHNLKIGVSKKSVNRGVISMRKVTVREKLMRFLFGDKLQLTVIVPGNSVESVCINEIEQEGECCEAI